MEIGGSSPPGGAGPLLAAPPCGGTTLELVSVLVSSYDFVSMIHFHLYNPPGLPEVCISCSRRVFVSICFCQEIVLSFRGIVASESDDKGKKPLEEDHQDPKLKEGRMTGGSRAGDPTFVGSMNPWTCFFS
jgi:hypothetical protein